MLCQNHSPSDASRPTINVATSPVPETAIGKGLSDEILTPVQEQVLHEPAIEKGLSDTTLTLVQEQFIYQHLDSNYTLPPRFEEEIPKILKNLQCPLQITKSSFVTVGSPHTWPVVLAALAFLVDLVNITFIIDSSLPEDDDDDEIGSPLHTCIEAFNCSDEAEENACLEAYVETLKANENVSEEDMVDLSEALEAAEHELESLPKVNDELKDLKQYNVKVSDDLAKLNNYLKDLKVAIENKSAMERSIKQSIMKLDIEESKILEEIERLMNLKNQQAYSTSELMQLKNHSQVASKEIEYQEQLSKDLGNQVCNLEIEISKFETILRNSTDQLKELVEKLSLNEEFPDIDVKSEDVIHHFDDIMCILTTLRKAAKKDASQTQEKMLQLSHDVERAKGTLQEKVAEGNKLKTKTRHVKEENKITQEEIKREIQLKDEELEELHQKIMEARKPQNKPAYHLHQVDDMITVKKQELEKCKKKEEKCLHDGLQFQKNFFERGMCNAEVQRKLIVEHTTRIKAEFTKLLEWCDSLDSD
ncbi:kinetochore protein NDC80 homolog [Portunus trituberculatus]|uniref:kinetochore protein NDC80 homolog n=1 Tax=Portunus trituberculatus TaxID=210409 RepID=UPI001E1CF99E|nr:kinetochore protein NDC80 homolog [Portunus trituberculatus]